MGWGGVGWYEWLSGSGTKEGARNASVAERIERSHYLAHNPPLKSDEAFVREGNLFAGYHFRKVKRTESGEPIKWPE
jgi:hypothetical protein